MPDFLDALIGQTRNTAPALRPRTPALFEPLPARPATSDSLAARPGISPGDPADAADAANAAHRPGAERTAAAPPPEIAGETGRPAPAAPLPRRLQDLDARLHRAETGRLPDAASPAGPRLAQAARPPGGAPQPDEVEGSRPAAWPAAQPALRPVVLLTHPAAQEPAGDLPARSPSGPSAAAGRPPEAGPAARAEDPGLSGRLQALAVELHVLRSSLQDSPGRAALLRPGSLLPPVERPLPPAQAPLQVQVSIGRVEVRAAPAPAPARPARAAGAAPASLDEYLRRINGGSR